MNNELEKINFYFAEAKKQFQSESGFAIDRKFYELWENIHQPRPFIVVGNEITLGKDNFKIVSEAKPKKACFSWDEQEACVSLIVEGAEWLDKIHIFVEDGEPVFSQIEPEFLEDMGLSYGERLEVIFDIIAYLREQHSHIDIFNIKRDEYLKSLESLSVRYDAVVLKVMKRLSMTSVRRLIRKAAEDMPHDELSDQLQLPLDGNYVALDKISGINNEPSNDTGKALKTLRVHGCTKWEVLRNLELLRNAAKFALEAEKAYIIPFKDAKMLARDGKFHTYQVPMPKDVPLQEGDIMGVFIRGENGEVGTFRVDIYDTDKIYGRIKFYDDPEKDSLLIDRIFARPTRSPLSFLAAGMEHLLNEFSQDAISPLLKELTGLKESNFIKPVGAEINSDMDEYQREAWECSLEDDNPVVLVQGPPGTGKTKVLVDVIRSLCQKGKRILVTAPSNTAVDNICRKVIDLPILRFGKNQRSIAPDVVSKCWIGEEKNVTSFVDQRAELGGGGIFAGTHVGLMKDNIIRDDMGKNGPYDVIVFDEAGMAAVSEFLMLAGFCKRVVLFGDHKQLPPFPLPDPVVKKLDEEFGPRLSGSQKMLTSSAMEWLADVRRFPVLLLKKSYRCQNPRLLRFSSILFYDALVTPSEKAEYFSLPFHERQKKYPQKTLRLISTSELPDEERFEKLVFEGGKPGLENRAEAAVCIHTAYKLLVKYPLNEITLIAPYKRQVRLMREVFDQEKAEKIIGKKITDKQWKEFLFNRISTVDSFQGGESDAVIICYVRSNKDGGIGFVDDANRINVAHTRCRREMVVIGDVECLKQNAGNDIFSRLERTVKRDGELLMLDKNKMTEINHTVFGAKELDIIDPDIVIPVVEELSLPRESELEITSKKNLSASEPEINEAAVLPEMTGMEQPDLF